MISNDEYSKLLDKQFETNNIITANEIISGTILKINDQHITVDIGYKSEGRIPKEEFLNTGSTDDLKKGAGVIKHDDDHRILMSFFIANMICIKNNIINDKSCVKTSYPTFFKHISQFSN